ncbi:MAG: hypothetical protein ACREWI_06885, partial [Telluria sp.]
MQHTLVAVFDNRTDAQNAMNELLSSNFSRQDVQLSNADPTGMTDSITGRSDTHVGEGIGATIKHFFNGLFGADDAIHASKYEGAVTRGHHVLTLRADSLPEVERAADIVERYGPTDIDEQASGTGAMGMAGVPESMRMSGAGGMQQSAPASAQSAPPTGGTLQGSSLEGSAYQGGATGSLQRDTALGGTSGVMRSTEIQRGRTRIYTPSSGSGLLTGGAWGDADESYRNHFLA